MTENCNLQGHSSLTPIYLYSHRMNFGLLCVENSSLHFDVSKAEARSIMSLNGALVDADVTLQ